MPLLYQPPVGSIVMCNFEGVPPEMVKLRPAVVIGRNRDNRGLLTVVPVSTTPPVPTTDYHHELTVNPLLGKPGEQSKRSWAKCDMLATVGLHRLDRIKVGKDADGKRRYVVPKLSEVDLLAIRTCVKIVLHLT